MSTSLSPSVPGETSFTARIIKLLFCTTLRVPDSPCFGPRIRGCPARAEGSAIEKSCIGSQEFVGLLL
jgi:hypothetical protein